MRILKKLKETFIGKPSIESLQERAANKEIRKSVNAARLRTRKEEAIKLAVATEKKIYSQRKDE